MKINISNDDRDLICAVLSYDIELNKKALATGKHPVSGFESSNWHECCIKRNQRLIKVLGGEQIEIPRSILGPCSTCYGYGLWGWGDPSPMGPLDASEGTPTIACPECGANANPIEDIIGDE